MKQKHAPVRYQCDVTLLFYAFFPFQSGSLPKWPKCVQKWSKYPGCQYLQLWKKSHKIKKFFHILEGHLYPTEAFRIGPEAQSGGPKAHH